MGDISEQQSPKWVLRHEDDADPRPRPILPSFERVGVPPSFCSLRSRRRIWSVPVDYLSNRNLPNKMLALVLGVNCGVAKQVMEEKHWGDSREIVWAP